MKQDAIRLSIKSAEIQSLVRSGLVRGAKVLATVLQGAKSGETATLRILGQVIQARLEKTSIKTGSRIRLLVESRNTDLLHLRILGSESESIQSSTGQYLQIPGIPFPVSIEFLSGLEKFFKSLLREKDNAVERNSKKESVSGSDIFSSMIGTNEFLIDEELYFSRDSRGNGNGETDDEGPAVLLGKIRNHPAFLLRIPTDNLGVIGVVIISHAEIRDKIHVSLWSYSGTVREYLDSQCSGWTKTLTEFVPEFSGIRVIDPEKTKPYASGEGWFT